jgi:hypothetical protein
MYKQQSLKVTPVPPQDKTGDMQEFSVLLKDFTHLLTK